MPDQLGDFFDLHWDREYVSHNTAFDFWVLVQARPDFKSFLFSLVEQGLWHDTMLLDLLVRLGQNGGFDGLKPANLGELSVRWGNGLVVDKTDPYRLRYSEIIGKRIEDVTERGFFDYAVLDPYATIISYTNLRKVADSIVTRVLPDPMAGRFNTFPDAHLRWGPLTESVQVKAAVALADIGRRGIKVDADRITSLDLKLRDRRDKVVAWIRENHHDLLDYYKMPKSRAGQLKVNKKTETPKFKTKEMRALLTGLRDAHNLTIPVTEKTGDISAAVAVWRDALPDNELIKKWSDLADVGKTLQFVVKVKAQGDVVRTKYRTLVSTGRTGASSVNIQNIPREPEFRAAFVPRPGKKFAVIDYAVVELRTLASVNLSRYGWSRMAEVIKEGRDLHVHTAASMLGLSYTQWDALTKVEKKHHRQAAKAINFGVPGGLGPNKLAVYARMNYGVDISVEQATTFKTKLITEVYPELSLYLADSSLSALADTLGVQEGELCVALGARRDNDLAIGGIRKIIRGTPFKLDGTPYNSDWVERVWDGLDSVSQNLDTATRYLISKRQGSDGLERKLFERPVSTLTGRVRARVGYTEERNTPFQGLAADGAKVALWELLTNGIEVVAFVHDECVVEVSEDNAEEEADRAALIMSKAMESVMHPDVPCVCSVTVGDCWEKD